MVMVMFKLIMKYDNDSLDSMKYWWFTIFISITWIIHGKPTENTHEKPTVRVFCIIHRFLLDLLMLLSVVYLSLSALCLIIVRNVLVTLIWSLNAFGAGWDKYFPEIYKINTLLRNFLGLNTHFLKKLLYLTLASSFSYKKEYNL